MLSLLCSVFPNWYLPEDNPLHPHPSLMTGQRWVIGKDIKTSVKGILGLEAPALEALYVSEVLQTAPACP